MEEKIISPWLVEIPKIAVIIFIVFNVVAMFLYSGGTFFNHDNVGYSFTRNFLSDLGRTISFSDKQNFFSSMLFNMSLILAGSVFIIFYFEINNVFQENKKYFISSIGTYLGVLGGLSMIIVGFTPANLYLDIHIVASTWIFRFFFLSSLCYSLVILQSSMFDSRYSVGYIFFTVSILLYIAVSEFGPSPKVNEFALTFQVMSQKIILFIFLCTTYFQASCIQNLRK